MVFNGSTAQTDHATQNRFQRLEFIKPSCSTLESRCGGKTPIKWFAGTNCWPT
jgi:hypothetical protein